MKTIDQLGNAEIKAGVKKLLQWQLDKGFKAEQLHTYKDANSKTTHWRAKLRAEEGTKQVYPIRYNAGNFELKEPEFNGKKPLYGLELIEQSSVIYVVEGEAIADQLNGIGIVAVSTTGATSHDSLDFTPLSGKAVTLWPDNDEGGKNHMQAVRAILNGLGCTTHLIDIDALGLELKGDAVDWLEKHHPLVKPKGASDEVKDLARDAVLNLAHVVDAVLSNSVIRENLTTETDTGNEVVAEGGPKKNQLKVKPVIRVNLVQGSSVKMRPITWLIDQWLPVGKLTLLAGAGGTGKTTFSLGIASAITCGGLFPNGQRYLGKSNVIMWSSEDDKEDVLAPRLAAMGADLGRVFFLDDASEDGVKRNFDASKDLGALKSAIDHIGSVALIIIDPIMGLVDGNSDKANDVRKSLNPLVDFCEAQQCAIIGISHFGKGGAGKDPTERILGSQAFTALPRMVWATVIDKDSGDRLLTRTKSNISRTDGGFIYGIEQTQFQGIETSIATWKGQIEGDSKKLIIDAEAVEIYDDGDHEGGESAKDFAKQFLADILSEKDMSTKELQAQARDADIKWATVRRAGTDLEVKKYNSPMLGGWAWSFKNSSEKEALKEAYRTCSSSCSNTLEQFNDEQVPKLEQVPVDSGSQLAQIIENGELAQVAQVYKHGEIEGNLAQNLSKSELDASWDTLINEPEAEKSAVRTGF